MNSVATNKTQQYNTRTKDYIYKWRQKNMDKYRIINREGQAKYREKHKDKIKMYKKAYNGVHNNNVVTKYVKHICSSDSDIHNVLVKQWK